MLCVPLYDLFVLLRAPNILLDHVVTITLRRPFLARRRNGGVVLVHSVNPSTQQTSLVWCCRNGYHRWICNLDNGKRRFSQMFHMFQMFLPLMFYWIMPCSSVVIFFASAILLITLVLSRESSEETLKSIRLKVSRAHHKVLTRKGISV